MVVDQVLESFHVRLPWKKMHTVNISIDAARRYKLGCRHHVHIAIGNVLVSSKEMHQRNLDVYHSA